MVHFCPEKLNRIPKIKGAHIFHKLSELPQNTMCHKGDTQQAPHLRSTSIRYDGTKFCALEFVHPCPSLAI